jgi:hypothetical protein
MVVVVMVRKKSTQATDVTGKAERNENSTSG